MAIVQKKTKSGSGFTELLLDLAATGRENRASEDRENVMRPSFGECLVEKVSG